MHVLVLRAIIQNYTGNGKPEEQTNALRSIFNRYKFAAKCVSGGQSHESVAPENLYLGGGDAEVPLEQSVQAVQERLQGRRRA